MSQNGADADTGSSASGSQDPNDVYLEESESFTIDSNGQEFQEAIGKLDDLKIEPDSNVPEMTSAEAASEQDRESIGTGSLDSQNSGEQDKDGNSKSNSPSKGAKAKGDKEKKGAKGKVMSVFDRLKRLTKFDKTERSTLKSNYSKFKGVKIDRLPQCFVAKYLGKREVKGLFGLQHVRAPVDELIAKVREDLQTMDRVELPLVYIVFSSKGLDIREHPGNKMKAHCDFVLHPIDFISYGVQDMKYWRVFTFIVVNELSLREKKMECHAFLADSSQNARKMALALGACFHVYKRKLAAEGKPHNFQVELRPPDELVDNLENAEATDFEA